MSLQVRKVQTLKDKQRFIQFPFDLYRNRSQWVPPMRSDVKDVLDREHPFYQHSEAEFFLAIRKGRGGERVQGRIAVLENKRYNCCHGRKVAFFYYFESLGDLFTTRPLFEAALEWTEARGLNELCGPMGFHPLDGRGILIKGFDHIPPMGIPWNPPSYKSFMEEMGFEKWFDSLSGPILKISLSERIEEVVERVMDRGNFWIKSFQDKKEMWDWIPKIHQVYNRSFPELNEGHYPMTEREIQWAAEHVLEVADPRLIKLIMKRKKGEDEPVGFILGYPNLTRSIQKAKGRIWPLGWAHLLWGMWRTNWIDFNGIGIVPEYRGLGANALLYKALKQSIPDQELYQSKLNLVQIRETNAKSMGEAKNFDIAFHQRHRTYKREL